MHFEEITIVPFITEHLDKCYKYADEDIKIIIKDEIECNPITYRINTLDTYNLQYMFGYFDTDYIIIFEENYHYTTLLQKCINNLIKKTPYNRFIIFNNKATNDDIKRIMCELIMTDIFETKNIEHYALYSVLNNPQYIIYILTILYLIIYFSYLQMNN